PERARARTDSIGAVGRRAVVLGARQRSTGRAGAGAHRRPARRRARLRDLLVRRLHSLLRVVRRRGGIDRLGGGTGARGRASARREGSRGSRDGVARPGGATPRLVACAVGPPAWGHGGLARGPEGRSRGRRSIVQRGGLYAEPPSVPCEARAT